jgi:hypothetical protein
VNVYLTATPQALIQAAITTLTNHGHQILGPPQGPFMDASLLKVDPTIGPQLVGSVGTAGGPWYAILSQA